MGCRLHGRVSFRFTRIGYFRGGPVYPVSLMQLGSDFIRRTMVSFVGIRPFGCGGTGLREHPPVHPYKWLGPDFFPLLHFFSVSLLLLRVVLGFLLILLGLVRNSERLGFPTFFNLGKGRPASRKWLRKSMAGCPCFSRFLFLS